MLSPISCILSKFYIKPQRVARQGYTQAVVSYRNSTSNHNSVFATESGILVVSYRNSTSNHNSAFATESGILVVSYRNSTSNHNILAFQIVSITLYLIEILHQTTTIILTEINTAWLYLIEILHQTTTQMLKLLRLICCILSKFYIKPQPVPYAAYHNEVVSYRNSTSNHNTRT